MGERGNLKQVGAIWKPRDPSGKSKGTGEVSINGFKQKFFILPNDRKKAGSKQPDYKLLSSDPPERDDRSEAGESRQDQRREAPDETPEF